MSNDKITVGCIYPQCNVKVTSRGLCNNHYTYVHRLIKDGKTTWDELVKHGKCFRDTRRKHAGRDFTEWLFDFKNE